MQDPPEINDVIVKLKTKLPVCRVCLNISLEYIEFDSTLCLVNGIEISYSDGFNLIAPTMVDLSENALKTFCTTCGQDLLNSYLFRKRVENANIILSQIKDFNEETPSNMVTTAHNLEVEIKGSDKSDDEYCNNDLYDGSSIVKETFPQVGMAVMKNKEHAQANKKSKTIKKKMKAAEFDEPWPLSPRNSLYTDSESESSEGIASESNELPDEKIGKLNEPIIWMCNDCGDVCMSRGMLRNHRRQHQMANNCPTKCKKCDKTLKTVEELDSHLGFHKFSEFTLDNMGKSYFRCKVCERKYRSEIDFVDHLNIHRDKKPHICKNCGETYHTKHLLRLHSFRIHKNTHKKTLRFKKTNVEKKDKCLHCCKMVRKSFMEIHVEKHLGPRSSVCTECGKQFNSKLALRTHSLIHTQSGEFLCHMCNKICQTMYALKSHIQFKHLMDKSLTRRKKPKYQCEDCGLIFEYPSKLRVHQRKHTADPTYKCPHCSRSYLRKDQFNIHMRYHNNDLPYKCDRCDKSYATKNNLTEHTKSVHDNITYDCDKCNHKFKSVTGLRKHKFLHTGHPYVCPICGLGQPFRSGIKAHLLRVHKDTFTEEEFDETFPVIIPKSGFRRPKT